MKTIRLTFTDVDRNSLGALLSWLGEAYDLKFTDDDPDFVIHSCFGRDCLNFEGVRIGWFGENIDPDFNISDYASGFSRLSYGERFRRIPLYRWYTHHYEPLFAADRTLRPVSGVTELLRRSLFCTLVVSNASRGSFFHDVVGALETYKPISSGGRWRNNVGGPVIDKLDFLRRGRFHLAFENTSAPGYVTEKILHAFATHTIPIYWGAPDIVEDFNPDAFISCNDCRSGREVLERVVQLDSDPAAYIRMLQAPCFRDGVEPEWLSKTSIMQWYRGIFDQPRSMAYRRSRHYWGAIYESQLRDAFFRPHKQGLRELRRRLRRLITTTR